MLGRSTGRVGSFFECQNEQCIFGARHLRPLSRKATVAAESAPQTRSAAVTEDQRREKRLQNEDVRNTLSAEREVQLEQQPTSTTSSNPLVNFWSSYQRRVETDPVPTKALTSFMGFVIGDILAQRIEGPAYNLFRTLRLGTYGLVLDGPVGHWWYTVLDKTVEPQNPRSTKAVALKTAADQLIWAPVMTCVFFAVLKSLEGHPELILPTIQDKLIKTVAANYVIWPAAHFINFRFVPTEHRILYNNIVSVAWTAWLSLVSHDPCPPSFSSLPELWQYMVAWTAYLSTLSHIPVVDVEDLSSQLMETQTQFFDALPPGMQTGASQAARAARNTLRGLPDIDALLLGRHFGLDLTIPKTIEIMPTRAVAGALFLRGLASRLGVQ